MPELPEVETLRRMIEASAVGRRVARVERSRRKLHVTSRATGLEPLVGRRLEGVDRLGKYLLLRFDGGTVLLSHLGMSGRWLFFDRTPRKQMEHVHARIRFEDGSALWFQDARRFGQLRVVAADRLGRDASLARLGRDPLAPPLTGSELARIAGGSSVTIKVFLLDQRKLAGIGNIYASEILFRAKVHPARRAEALSRREWDAVAHEIPEVLGEAIARMGTTFSTYRTLWNEPGSFGDQLRVYDRAGEPCRTCGTPIRRLVQGQRSTFYCPYCQKRGKAAT